MEPTTIRKLDRNTGKDKITKDHANDAFVLNKLQVAKQIIAKYGVPTKIK